MAFELVDIQRAVNAKLQDKGSFLTPDEVDECILSALNILNVDAPNQIPVDIAGADGVKNYAIGTDFVKGYSAARKLEHILSTDTDEDDPRFLVKTDNWFIYEDPTKAAGLQMRLRLKRTQPSTGDTLRLTLTTPFVLLPTSTIETVRDGQALSAKALQLCFEALAARFSQTTDPTIDADAVDYGGAPDRFLLLARDWRNIYNHLAGLDENIKAAFALKEVDLLLSTGEKTIWHEETRR